MSTTSTSPPANSSTGAGETGTHNDTSTIIAAATVVGFLILALTGLLLFLRITRTIRLRREKRRRTEALTGGSRSSTYNLGKRTSHKNAFEDFVEDEGVPA